MSEVFDLVNFCCAFGFEDAVRSNAYAETPMTNAGNLESVAPLAALCNLSPDRAFTSELQRQVIAIARLGANVPDKLSRDDVRTICRTLLYHVDRA